MKAFLLSVALATFAVSEARIVTDLVQAMGPKGEVTYEVMDKVTDEDISTMDDESMEEVETIAVSKIDRIMLGIDKDSDEEFEVEEECMQVRKRRTRKSRKDARKRKQFQKDLEDTEKINNFLEKALSVNEA